MNIEFISNIPKNYSSSPILISGEASRGFHNIQLLSLTKKDEGCTIYEIRYEGHCSPFRESAIVNNTIIVGHEAHCYLFDVYHNASLNILLLEGYFGHIYLENEIIYVTDAHGLYCLSPNGSLLWHNPHLGIDGVVIHEFDEAVIHGSGEWDPPGGWIDFALDKKTGLERV